MLFPPLIDSNDVYDELLLPCIFSVIVYLIDRNKVFQQEKVWSIEKDVKEEGHL